MKFVITIGTLALLFGCSTDNSTSDGADASAPLGTGAAGATGGSAATGGTPAASASGGAANGGSAQTGGSVGIGTGGGTGSGGITGAGGNAATGGASGSGGGTGAGGNATGGGPGSGGNPGTGGNVATGGDTGTGGNPGTGGNVATGGNTGTGGNTATGGNTGTGGNTATGGNTGTGGNTATGGNTGSGGNSGTGGNVSTGGGAGTDGGSPPTWSAGNPDGSCSAGVPTEGQPADVSNPTTVVGTGTPGSCTFSALSAAVSNGGVITFDCGGGAVTIPILSTLNVPINKDTVIDGGRRITLDGQNNVRIMSFDSGNWQNNEHRLTLQHIALVNGKATPTEAIPTAPAPCSQGWNDGQGGAVYMRDGNLTVIDSIFTGNHAAPLGPDTGGGAIYVQGSKHGTVVAGSTFTQNAASNAGALGGLFCEHHIYDSLFSQNTATGHDANNNDPSKCSAMNNGQNEIGSGGNGGAIYSDGNNVNIVLCGDKIVNNAAGVNAFGGGLFFTSNNYGGTLSIADTTMTGNTGGHWTNVQSGSITNIGAAVGTNCKSITVQNSTIQGYP